MYLGIAWVIAVLGALHILLGLIRFRTPLKQIIKSGYVGRFGDSDLNRSAFWFIIFGPLLMLVGHVAVYAASSNNAELLKIIGSYLLVISAVAVVSVPKAPFWITLALSIPLIFQL